jgi:hypothetical protein
MRDLCCTCCSKPLTNGLDTFGLPGDEQCWSCYSATMPGAPEDDWYIIPSREELDEQARIDAEEAEIAELVMNGEIPEDGIIEVRGMPFCWACGMLAQPGEEEFDWCSHLPTERHCAYLSESEDDEDELEGDGGE